MLNWATKKSIRVHGRGTPREKAGNIVVSNAKKKKKGAGLGKFRCV